MIVQAKDKSNNQSGAIDYKINFEVINKATITEVMNYPNPFSTATHFVFTLTGSQVPTYFKIQIMTITGKVVREITNDELGDIHIGRNITEYAWDGKDEFGDQLANGVYLYHVVTTLRGDNIEKRDSGADQYFKKGFGKMYLMR
jgi:flagellar hook assembly protein FlgD